MRYWELEADEDSACGLLHIVSPDGEYVCKGHHELAMMAIVEKLNIHAELAGLLKRWVADFECWQRDEAGPDDVHQIAGEAQELLAKLEAEE